MAYRWKDRQMSYSKCKDSFDRGTEQDRAEDVSDNR